MEKDINLFEQIRSDICEKHAKVHPAKMMHAQAIGYNDKVFAFLSKSGGMVFKLGKDFHMDSFEGTILEFNPFKNKGPLAGWFELPASEQSHWDDFTNRALDLIQN